MAAWTLALLPTSQGGWVATHVRTADVARVPDEILDAVVYLYRSKGAASVGDTPGGTGFLVSFAHERGATTYVITNRHVIKDGFTTIRVNTSGGGVESVEIPPEAWVMPSGPDDIAAASLINVSTQDWAARPLIWADVFLDKASFDARMDELNVGIGDDVFMAAGRFSGHSGRQQNQPVVRYGNISLMAGPPVRDADGHDVTAYLVEMRSLPGYSGSPVFLHIPPGIRGNGTMMPFYNESIALLGIDTGHKLASEPVQSYDKKGPVGDLYVKLNTGIAVVAPVWKIDELLRGSDLNDQRQDEPDRSAEEVSADSLTDDYGDDDQRVSLAPLDAEDAVRALLRTASCGLTHP